MSIKNNVVAAVLLVALTGTLASCGGGADVKDKVADAGKGAVDATKDAGGKAVDATKDAGGKAVDAVKGSGDAVKNAALIAPLVSQAKGPLGAVSVALKDGKMDKAKAGFEKFEGVWKTVGPKIQPLAGAKYDAINDGVTKLSAAVGGTDKKAATDALGGVMKALDAAAAKK